LTDEDKLNYLIINLKIELGGSNIKRKILFEKIKNKIPNNTKNELIKLLNNNKNDFNEINKKI